MISFWIPEPLLSTKHLEHWKSNKQVGWRAADILGTVALPWSPGPWSPGWWSFESQSMESRSLELESVPKKDPYWSNYDSL